MYSKRDRYSREITNTTLISNIERYFLVRSEEIKTSPAQLGKLYVKAKVSANQLRLNALAGDNSELNEKTSQLFHFIDDNIQSATPTVDPSDIGKILNILREIKSVVNN